MKANARILLVGSHEILMGSVAARIDREHCCTVIGLMATPLHAVEVLARQAADVLIMDIDGTADDCLNNVEALRAECPSLRVVFLSSHLEDSQIEHFLNASINGILLKSDLSAQLGTAIREVYAGGFYAPEDVRSRILVESDGIRLEENTSGDKDN